LFLRQTESRLPILEVCKVRFWQFCDCDGHIFTHGSSQKPELRYNYSTLTSYSVANETGNRIRILERCKFRFRYRFHHSSGLEQLRTQCYTISIKLCVRFGNVVSYLPLFIRQTGSRHTTLEVYAFRFGSFPIVLAMFFHGSSPKFEQI